MEEELFEARMEEELFEAKTEEELFEVDGRKSLTLTVWSSVPDGAWTTASTPKGVASLRFRMVDRCDRKVWAAIFGMPVEPEANIVAAR